MGKDEKKNQLTHKKPLPFNGELGKGHKEIIIWRKNLKGQYMWKRMFSPLVIKVRLTKTQLKKKKLMQLNFIKAIENVIM